MRRIVYGISFWIFLAAAACTIASIALPNWMSYHSPTSTDPIRVTYGLQSRCSSITGKCTPFPKPDDCIFEVGYFCPMWRSAGFFMNFTVIIELACVVAYITILAGGRASRESGWNILAALLAICAGAELIAMALVAYLYDHDNHFFVGWELGKSWILCTVSWTVMLVNALGIVAARLVMPKEDDYEPIPEPMR